MGLGGGVGLGVGVGLTLTLADRVQRELDAEAHAVGDGEDPRVDVAQPRAQHDAPLRLLLRPGLLELLDVAVGQVAAGERSTARDEAQRDGQEVGVAPRLGRGRGRG